MKTLLFASHTSSASVFRVGSHHLAREFTCLGWRVIHLSTPISAFHIVTGRSNRAAIGSAIHGPHEDSSRILQLVPLRFFPAGVGRIDYHKILRSVGIKQLDVTMIDQPLIWDKSLREVSKLLVYRPTDSYFGGLKRRLQQDIVASADGIVATSESVLRSLPQASIPSLVVNNGVDFKALQGDATSHRSKVAVYVGALDERFDLAAILKLADKHRDWSFRLYGPGRRPKELRNVIFEGPIRYSALKSILCGAGVGLLPLTHTAVNEGRSPMKLYEYLANGLSVVASETATIHQEARVGLYTYRDAGSMSEAFRLAASADSQQRRCGMDLAESMDWSKKARVLSDFLTRIS